jgi:hypothetical protein
MAIYGAVGYRANVVMMLNGELIVTSPMRTDFHWPQPVTWAECHRGCPVDEDNHVISEIKCSCGIYSTINPDILSYYVEGDNFVPILVECLGYYWYHESNRDPEIRGYTSAGVQVAAVIGDYVNRHVNTPHMWITALADFYSVPVISLEEGNALIDWSFDTFVKEKENEQQEVFTAQLR